MKLQIGDYEVNITAKNEGISDEVAVGLLLNHIAAAFWECALAEELDENYTFSEFHNKLGDDIHHALRNSDFYEQCKKEVGV